jgi:hypothetical protein
MYMTNGVPWSNSKILESADPNLAPQYVQNQTQWGEVYATTFQWVAYTSTHQQDTLDPTSAEFLAKGYMPCTTSWADSEFNGTAVPPTTPAYCSTATPSWYTPGQ